MKPTAELFWAALGTACLLVALLLVLRFADQIDGTDDECRHWRVRLVETQTEARDLVLKVHELEDERFAQEQRCGE